MKWKICKTSLMLFSALLMVSSADARMDRRNASRDRCDYGVGEGQGYGVEEDEMDMRYSAPARINCNSGWDVEVSGSFIYWLASQGQMDLATWQTTDAVPITGVVTQQFKFKPGFKLSLGTNFGHDDWTGKVDYTRIHFSTITSSSPPQSPGNGTLLVNPGWAGNALNGGSLNTLRTKWTCNLDVLDGELTRSYYSGRMLTFSPFFGPRFGWLRQRMRYDVTLLSAPTTLLSNSAASSSWFAGPRAGLDANYVLGWGFRVTGSTAASLLYQRQKVRADLTDASSNTSDTKVRDTARLVRPNAELGLGLGWGCYLMQNSWHLDILAAYEFHYWWDQNAIRSALIRNNNVQGAASPIVTGDLSYQGLTLTVRIDF